MCRGRRACIGWSARRPRLRRGALSLPRARIITDLDVIPGSADENARLRDAVETISEAFVLWDKDNQLVMCNSKYQQFHGLPDDMVRPGSPYDAVIAAASEPIVSKRVAVAGTA